MYKAKGWGFKKVLPLKLTVGKWEAMSFWMSLCTYKCCYLPQNVLPRIYHLLGVIFPWMRGYLESQSLRFFRSSRRLRSFKGSTWWSFFESKHLLGRRGRSSKVEALCGLSINPYPSMGAPVSWSRLINESILPIRPLCFLNFPLIERARPTSAHYLSSCFIRPLLLPKLPV